MMERSLSSLGPRGFHKIAYTEWGREDDACPIVCVHGLTRNSRDFDIFADAMARTGRRVVCPDMAGRGASEWLSVKTDYDFPLYMADCAALLARLGAEQVDWVGTSMGGIIGMGLASQPGSPIRRLVLNDIGPFIPKEGLARIREVVSWNPLFADLGEVEATLRTALRSFGRFTDEQWAHLARHAVRREEDGLRLHYDPGIVEGVAKGDAGDVDLWPLFEAVRCPVLILRGAQSDILTHDTAQEMCRRHPDCRMVEFRGVGHAPMLMDEEQINVVRDWLEK